MTTEVLEEKEIELKGEKVIVRLLKIIRIDKMISFRITGYFKERGILTSKGKSNYSNLDPVYNRLIK